MLSLIFVLASTALATDAPAPKPARAPTRIRWERKFAAALEKAKTEKKPVMVDFWAEWCHWCHELDRVTYRDRDVVTLSGDFVGVKVDTEGGRADTKIAADYRVESLPTIVFLSPEGRPIGRAEGYQSPQRFATHLKNAKKAAGEVIELETTLAADAKNGAALKELGARMFEERYYEDSRDLLRRALAVDSALPVKDRKRVRTLLGVILHFDNQPEEAVVLLKQALDLKPADAEEDAATLFTLGKSYMKTGRTTEARSALQKVVDGYPDSTPAVRAREALTALGDAGSPPR